MTDNAPLYTAKFIRSALLVASHDSPEAALTCAKIAWLLEIDIADYGDILPGWKEGTHPPPLVGFGEGE